MVVIVVVVKSEAPPWRTVVVRFNVELGSEKVSEAGAVVLVRPKPSVAQMILE